MQNAKKAWTREQWGTRSFESISRADYMVSPGLEIRTWRDQGITFPRIMAIHGTEGARRERRWRSNGPLITVDTQVSKVGQAVTVAGGSVTNFNIVVLPAVHLVFLHAWEEASLGEVEGNCGQKTTTDQVNCVVVGEVHGCPPHPKRVGDPQWLQPGEDLAHEQSSQSRIGSVQRRECTKHHRRLLEARSVQIDAQELVNATQACRVPLHRIVGWGKTIQVLIPWRGAWEKQLDGNGSHANVSQSPGVKGDSPGRAKDEHDRRDNKRSTVVTKPVRNPGQNVKHHILVGRQNVTDVGTVEDIL